MLPTKSSMDSLEEAQNLVSPLPGSASQYLSASSTTSASGEAGEKENNSRRYGRWANEKGIESASSLGSKGGGGG